MAYTAQFGSKRRDYLYSRDKNAAGIAGRGDYPICPHCDRPVSPGQMWDEVHIGVPKVFGGKSTGVGHRECNRRDNNEVVTPAFAKAEAVRKKHVGIKGPGLGRAPMRCGRRSGQTSTMAHGIQPRKTYAEKHRALMAKRSFGLSAVALAKVDAVTELTP